jgi:hypothetical protein
MQRPLTTPNADGDVQFKTGQFTPIAFFAWDGNNNETGSRCSISTWYDLLLKPKTPLRAYAFPPLAVLLVGGLGWWGKKKISKKP